MVCIYMVIKGIIDKNIQNRLHRLKPKGTPLVLTPSL